MWALMFDFFATCSGIFRDKRGHFHILGHWFQNGKGGHAYSKDGLHWTFAGDAYDGELEWDDGTFLFMITLRPLCISNAILVLIYADELASNGREG